MMLELKVRELETVMGLILNAAQVALLEREGKGETERAKELRSKVRSDRYQIPMKFQTGVEALLDVLEFKTEETDEENQGEKAEE